MNLTKRRFYKHLKRILPFVLISAAGIIFLLPKILATGDPDLKNKVHIVVIDAGHGGKDPGAMGSFAKEKDVVLGVALKLGKYIEDNFDDVKVIYTRDKDVFIPLYDRADIANKANADLFISIHANSSTKNYVYGSETFVMGEHKSQSNFDVAKTENNVITLEDNYTTKYDGFDPNSLDSYIMFSLMQRTYLNQSLKFASKVQDEFREKARRADRGVLQAGFLVLWRTSMPSVLIETGFISHPDEEKYLSSEQGQDYLASAIYRAFKSYKAEIENSSNFERKPDVIKSNEEPKENVNPPSPSGLYYKVQIFSSRNKVDNNDPAIKDFPELEYFSSGKWFKFAAGKFGSYEEASKYLNQIRDKYPDAFVIAVNNGEIIPLSEAKQLLK
ncbi:MAG: N-acetylmuramoyl-L-alanine amidase [Bacteroidales bacterium]|nr:N-acetylmuramoyl-L-alanine amidase [Bacteroidales bacterium]